jgi:hypothetical protein
VSVPLPNLTSPAPSAPLPGLEAVLRAFYQIVDDIKRKPYDLLDYAHNTFDRDYLEFNVNIHDLDSQMQACWGWCGGGGGVGRPSLPDGRACGRSS